MDPKKISKTFIVVILTIYLSSCGRCLRDSSVIPTLNDFERSIQTNQHLQQDHKFFMKRAILLAKRSRKYPFGAVIVRRNTGEIVAEGFNQSQTSPTFHAEIDAINRCARTHPLIKWKDLVIYTTAEPCAMCQSAIEWSGISAVYYGSSIPYLQTNGWRQIDIRAEEVARRTPFRETRIFGGFLEEECNLLYKKSSTDATQ
jgi:tRNA(Arg) A34 adenosine deaminase TadA